MCHIKKFEKGKKKFVKVQDGVSYHDDKDLLDVGDVPELSKCSLFNQNDSLKQ